MPALYILKMCCPEIIAEYQLFLNEQNIDTIMENLSTWSYVLKAVEFCGKGLLFLGGILWVHYRIIKATGNVVHLHRYLVHIWARVFPRPIEPRAELVHEFTELDSDNNMPIIEESKYEEPTVEEFPDNVDSEPIIEFDQVTKRFTVSTPKDEVFWKRGKAALDLPPDRKGGKTNIRSVLPVSIANDEVGRSSEEMNAAEVLMEISHEIITAPAGIETAEASLIHDLPETISDDDLNSEVIKGTSSVKTGDSMTSESWETIPDDELKSEVIQGTSSLTTKDSMTSESWETIPDDELKSELSKGTSSVTTKDSMASESWETIPNDDLNSEVIKGTSVTTGDSMTSESWETISEDDHNCKLIKGTSSTANSMTSNSQVTIADSDLNSELNKETSSVATADSLTSESQEIIPEDLSCELIVGTSNISASDLSGKGKKRHRRLLMHWGPPKKEDLEAKEAEVFLDESSDDSLPSKPWQNLKPELYMKRRSSESKQKFQSAGASGKNTTISNQEINTKPVVLKSILKRQEPKEKPLEAKHVRFDLSYSSSSSSSSDDGIRLPIRMDHTLDLAMALESTDETSTDEMSTDENLADKTLTAEENEGY